MHLLSPKSDIQKSDWMPVVLGNYEIDSLLGRGGMGDIYKATQKHLNRTVALKVLSPHLSRNEEFSQRFEIEAKAISLLQHQNIVSIYEYGEEKGLKFFAMQYIEGEDLSKRIAGKKTIPVSDIVAFSKQICRGLRYAHSRNVIHRDIKPQNVLLDENNICKLSDFGIAKIFEQKNITMTGMAVGTPEYMSPEQAEGSAVDIQTDIYSLGVLIYEMLAKRPPFTGNNPVAVAYKQVHEYPVPPSAHRKDIPKRLELIVLKALKKNRKERYRSIEEMLQDLDTVNVDTISNDTTISFAIQRKSADKKKPIEDKRITDRRSGDRRQGSRRGDMNHEGWIGVLKNQALSLILFLILSILFLLHLIGHP